MAGRASTKASRSSLVMVPLAVLAQGRDPFVEDSAFSKTQVRCDLRRKVRLRIQGFAAVICIAMRGPEHIQQKVTDAISSRTLQTRVVQSSSKAPHTCKRTDKKSSRRFRFLSLSVHTCNKHSVRRLEDDVAENILVLESYDGARVGFYSWMKPATLDFMLSELGKGF
eukprot:5928-Amphidinium_carterae.1